MPLLSRVQDTGDDYHRATEDSPFFHSAKRNSTRSPSKPSKSVQELRRIYKRSNTQRSRRALTSSIPYYKKVKPEENGRQNYATRSSSLNLAGESTKTKIRNFSSKYLPYYSKLQQNFLNQTRDKSANPTNNGQKKLPPNTKKPPNKAVHTNTPATNPSSHDSATLVSDMSTGLHTNILINMTSQSSITILSKSSQIARVNTPANMSSESSIAILSKPSQTVHMNTPANMSSQSSIAILSEPSQTVHMNTPANMFSQSSVTTLSELPETAHVNGSTQSSSPTPPQPLAPRYSITKSPRLSAPSRNSPTPNASLTCVALQKPDGATQRSDRVPGRVKSLCYFLDLSDEAGTLEEWGEVEKEVRPASSANRLEETSRSTVESREFHQSDSIVQGWSNDRPSTRSTEYPEETEETLVDYWFMSEDEFEDESSDDVEEGGLKMKFLQLD